MIIAFSRLQRILRERSLTIPDLHRRIESLGMGVNIKSLYRLNDEQQPLSRLDLRVAGAICEACDVGLGELVDFDQPNSRLKLLSTAKQHRLDSLMDKNNDGKLTRMEHAELQKLVRETQEITLQNARMLAEHQKRLQGD